MPPKPVSILAAETHREAMKVRRIQEATAEEKGLPNGWEGVEADPSFDYDQWVVDNAEPFKFSCSPLELSELGPGVVLYFDLVKYLGVLMFCFSAFHVLAIYINSTADEDILLSNNHGWNNATLGSAMADSVRWVANKRFEISKFKFKFPRARTYEIIGLVLGCIEAKFCK